MPRGISAAERIQRAMQRLREEDALRNLLDKIPGYAGYQDREQRRETDKRLREHIALRLGAFLDQLNGLQQQLGMKALAVMDDFETVAMRIQRLQERIRTASYGYAGLFDAVQVKAEQLRQLYAFDAAFLEAVEELGERVKAFAAEVAQGFDREKVEATLRELAARARELNEFLDRRKEVFLAEEAPEGEGEAPEDGGPAEG